MGGAKSLFHVDRNALEEKRNPDSGGRRPYFGCATLGMDLAENWMRVPGPKEQLPHRSCSASRDHGRPEGGCGGFGVGGQLFTQERQRPSAEHPSSTVFPVAQSWTAHSGVVRAVEGRASVHDRHPTIGSRGSAATSPKTVRRLISGYPLPGVDGLERCRRTRGTLLGAG